MIYSYTEDRETQRHLTANMLTNSKTRVGLSVLIYMEDERGPWRVAATHAEGARKTRRVSSER